MVGIRFAQGVSRALMDRLAAARVYVSVRGDSIRVAPHLYNDRSDISRFLAALGAATGDREVGSLPGFEPARR
jgi:selenocysteine lyase/cysteine desulfurase